MPMDHAGVVVHWVPLGRISVSAYQTSTWKMPTDRAAWVTHSISPPVSFPYALHQSQFFSSSGSSTQMKQKATILIHIIGTYVGCPIPAFIFPTPVTLHLYSTQYTILLNWLPEYYLHRLFSSPFCCLHFLSEACSMALACSDFGPFQQTHATNSRTSQNRCLLRQPLC